MSEVSRPLFRSINEGGGELVSVNPSQDVGVESSAAFDGQGCEPSPAGSQALISFGGDTVANASPLPVFDERDFAEHIVRRVARGRPSADTVQGYLSDAKQFLGWVRNYYPRLDLLDEDAIERYRADLVAQGLRPATIARRLVVIRALLDAWVREERAQGRVVANPARDVEPPAERQTPEERIRWLSLDQVRALLAASDVYEQEEPARAARDRLLLALLTLHGLRLVEIHRLDQEDVLYRGTVLVLRVRGKRHDRDVYLRADAVPLLERWMALRDRAPILKQRGIHLERQQRGDWGADRAMQGMERQGGIPLFTSLSVQNYGARLTRRGLHFIVTTYLKAIGAKPAQDQRGITPHTLRHTFATQALAAGASLEQLQDQGGWVKPETVRRYAHVLGRAEQNPSELIPVALKLPRSNQHEDEPKTEE